MARSFKLVISHLARKVNQPVRPRPHQQYATASAQDRPSSESSKCHAIAAKHFDMTKRLQQHEALLVAPFSCPTPLTGIGFETTRTLLEHNAEVGRTRAPPGTLHIALHRVLPWQGLPTWHAQAKSASATPADIGAVKRPELAEVLNAPASCSHPVGCTELCSTRLTSLQLHS